MINLAERFENLEKENEELRVQLKEKDKELKSQLKEKDKEIESLKKDIETYLEWLYGKPEDIRPLDHLL